MDAWTDTGALRTVRLDLEPLRVGHAEEMAGVLGDPSLHTYIGGTPATPEQLRDRYRLQTTGRSPDGSQLWFNWVVRRRDTGAAVGTMQATVGSERGETVAEVAWVIGAAHQRHGYAKEAALAVAAWLRQHGVAMLIAHVHPHHAASIAVARSIGLSATDVLVDGETRWQG